MPDLPDPRPDGKCVDCNHLEAVTNDNRFCRKCLRRRIKDETPIVSMTIREELGRRRLSFKVLSGQPHMGHDGDDL
jgi:hypothetical protein